MIDTAVVNGEYDFQIPQANEKKTYFMFYILTIHSAITNKETYFYFSPVLS